MNFFIKKLKFMMAAVFVLLIDVECNLKDCRGFFYLQNYVFFSVTYYFTTLTEMAHQVIVLHSINIVFIYLFNLDIFPHSSSKFDEICRIRVEPKFRLGNP